MEKKKNLDMWLKEEINNYNIEYTKLSDYGTRLFLQRTRTVDLIINVENLINSIANHPKEFDKEISKIATIRKNFKDTCDFAKQELETAQKCAISAGAGIAGGVAVASLAPSAAMWVATTFGTASTGTAISALSGAAANSAALAWLGGGTLATGGGGVVAGKALLALSGPIGWGIAGATLLTSVVLIANKKTKIRKQKIEEIKNIQKNIKSVQESAQKIKLILDKTSSLRDGVNMQYDKCLNSYGKDFELLKEDAQLQLGILVNETKVLTLLLEEGV